MSDLTSILIKKNDCFGFHDEMLILFMLLSIVVNSIGSLIDTPGVILGLHPTTERRRYFVTTSLIGWAQA